MSTTWAHRLDTFLPGFLRKHPVLSQFEARASVIAYGSVMMGVDDEICDLDVWLLMPAEDLATLDACCPSHFFEFELDGKMGHVTVQAIFEFADRLDHCHMDTVFQLRRAMAITDHAGVAGELIELATMPMRREVRDAFFFYHYVEMRGEHPLCAKAIDRQMPLPLLLTMPKILAHALQAAMILDGEPYPYDKWLLDEARKTATGRRLAPSMDRILDHLAAGHLLFDGPRAEHPIDRELRVIRQTLIDAARARGCDELWLREWWHYMDHARNAVKDIRWQLKSEAFETPR